MKIAIWGSGGHAKVVADIIRSGGRYEIAAFIDDGAGPRPDRFRGVPVVGNPGIPDHLRRLGIAHVVIGVGDNATRMRLGEAARAAGFRLATAIHPGAIVSQDAVVGEGTVLMAGAVVNPDATIGDHVIINTGATVDHDCDIRDGAHLSPGVHLAGHVTVGRATWIGVGTSVIHRIRIGSQSIIGAGAVVVGDIPDQVVAYGVPARVRKTNG